jgi:type VI secretion system protein ImpH
LPSSIERALYAESGRFNFFQAVSLLEELGQGSYGVGRGSSPRDEAVRFRAALGSVFPQNSIHALEPAPSGEDSAVMTVAFLGLTGPSGVLPRHYTELLTRIERLAKSSEKHALRDWLDLFNHRLIGLFYRAWTKYRFPSAYSRREFAWREPDTFTEAVFSLAGLGFPSLKQRLRVSTTSGDIFSRHECVLAEIKDLSLLRYSGLLAQRPRTASNLGQLLRDYIALPVEVEQFDGQWLVLESENRTQLAAQIGNNQLGVSAIAGERVWDRQSKIRLRIGPLDYRQFAELLPDQSPQPERKTFFVLCHLARLYLGPETDFRVQLVLRRDELPPCRLSDDAETGPRLGWNAWLYGEQPSEDADDAVFEEAEPRWIGD